jgi:D-inositol-3-phosphate glycosyltransferase
MFLFNSRRIALISDHGDPAAEIGREEAGGQNVYVRKVGEALAAKGWIVDMFTRYADPSQPQIVQHSPNCRTIRLKAGPVKFIPRDEIFEYMPEFLQSLLHFQQQIGVRYKVVHTHYWMSAWVAMELRKRQPLSLVHTYHSLGAVKYQSVPTVPLVATQRLEVEKACLRTADRIVATSPQEKAHMRSLMSKQGRIDIIPCGTDIDHFGSLSQSQGRQLLGLDPAEKVVLYVGRFDPRKGIETLVRAIAQSQSRHQENLRVILGGGSRPGQSDGLERDRIEQLCGDLGIAHLVQFPGRLSPEELPRYYAAADVCVVPSHYEPFGLVAIEAMACGTPVIASDVGGLQYTVLPERTGLLAPPRDAASFAQSLDRILEDPQWCHQLGQAARQRVEEEFSWKGVAGQLSHLYHKLLRQQPTKPQQPALAKAPASAAVSA